MARMGAGVAAKTTRGGAEPGCNETLGWWWPLVIALWFGLVAGLVELLLLVIRVELLDKGFFLRIRHIVWMGPISDVLIFGAVGFLMIVPWPKIGRLPVRMTFAILLFLGLMSQLLLLRGLNFLSCAVFSAGLACQASRRFATYRRGIASAIRWSAPLLASVLAGVLALAILRNADVSSSLSGRTVAERGAPNVLLIAMDTVRADHLSVYGYHRATSPRLERLAARGIRFDLARSTAPWTLPSHASMFTGRWPHELGVERLGWLDGSRPTLAEHLRSRGYETAGFVANTFFCGHESGLDRGFDTYQDYPVGPTEVLRSSSMGWLLAQTASRVCGELAWLLGGDPGAGITLDFARKEAGAVSAEFLSWLDRKRSRPFFAFLNYFDAHDPYLPVRDGRIVLDSARKSRAAYAMLRDWQKLQKDELSTADRGLALAAYDECIAALDRELGKLFDELERRGVLDDTLLIVTADHGEQFGEHGDFGHGFSVYQAEVRVPLLIHFPRKVPKGHVVREAVSLRDVPSTVLELAGLDSRSPFPGNSLSAFWKAGEPACSREASAPLSELAAPIETASSRPTPPESSGSVQSVVADRHVFIRHAGGGEELYDLDADPEERSNLIASANPERVERLRGLLEEKPGSRSSHRPVSSLIDP